MSGANKPELHTSDIDDESVAEYLQAHPDFFERHQNLEQSPQKDQPYIFQSHYQKVLLCRQAVDLTPTRM